MRYNEAVLKLTLKGNMMKIEISHLKAILNCAGKQDTRNFLNGVHIKGETMEASNGHVAARLKCEGANFPDIVIPRTIVEIAHKAHAGAVELTDNLDGTYRLGDIHFTPIYTGDAGFPDLDRVIPVVNGYEPVERTPNQEGFMGIDFKVLKLVMQTSKQIYKREALPITNSMLNINKSQALYFQLDNLELWVMPCRIKMPIPKNKAAQPLLYKEEE